VTAIVRAQGTTSIYAGQGAPRNRVEEAARASGCCGSPPAPPPGPLTPLLRRRRPLPPQRLCVYRCSHGSSFMRAAPTVRRTGRQLMGRWSCWKQLDSLNSRETRLLVVLGHAHPGLSDSSELAVMLYAVFEPTRISSDEGRRELAATEAALLRSSCAGRGCQVHCIVDLDLHEAFGATSVNLQVHMCSYGISDSYMHVLCMYIQAQYRHICICTEMHILFICLYVYVWFIYACIHLDMSVCAYVRPLCIYVYICTCVYVYVLSVYVCICVCNYMHLYMYVCVCIRLYLYV
jgi:hypothetical protein